MSKILVLTNHSYMLYRFRLALLLQLQQKHEVVISTPFVGHEEDFLALGMRCIETPVDRRGINPLREIELLRFYQRLLRQEKPDLVITYSIKPNIYGGYLCRREGIPYCANVQGLGSAFERRLLAWIVSRMYRPALRGARTVFFENSVNAETFVRHKIIPARQCTVLSGAGIDLEQFRPAAYPENDPIRFLYLGRIMQEKGMDELFLAARRLRQAGVDFTLELVGFYEDEYKQEVEALCRDGIARFHGFQQDPRPFYAAADCVVMPSYHEGMSNVLLEAAAMARPVITTAIPGCREAVRDGVSGFLCRPRDMEDLLRAMQEMARLPREQRAAMGEAGRKKMEQQFDKKQVVQATFRAIFPDEAP